MFRMFWQMEIFIVIQELILILSIIIWEILPVIILLIIRIYMSMVEVTQYIRNKYSYKVQLLTLHIHNPHTIYINGYTKIIQHQHRTHLTSTLYLLYLQVYRIRCRRL